RNDNSPWRSRRPRRRSSLFRGDFSLFCGNLQGKTSFARIALSRKSLRSTQLTDGFPDRGTGKKFELTGKRKRHNREGTGTTIGLPHPLPNHRSKSHIDNQVLI